MPEGRHATVERPPSLPKRVISITIPLLGVATMLQALTRTTRMLKLSHA